MYFIALMRKFTKNSTLAEILEKEGTEKILAKFNLPCLTCPMIQLEIQNLKLGDVCKIYGIDIDKLLKELNKNLAKNK
jgi:hypothetical protein